LFFREGGGIKDFVFYDDNEVAKFFALMITMVSICLVF
jgi:hypothetical protein